MRKYHPFQLIFALLAIYSFSLAGVVLNAYQPDNFFPLLHARQGSGGETEVPTGGQQDTNASSTEGTNGLGSVPNDPDTDPNGDGVNCMDLTTGRSNKCWDELDLNDWIEDWLNNNSCRADEAFASCFLRKEKIPGLDCRGININACVPPQGEIVNTPQAFYVAYNIYAINQFFTSWWTAVGDSASLAQSNIDQIVQLLDPPSELNVVLNDVFLALQCVFALVPGPLGIYAAEVRKFSATWQSLAQVGANALLVEPNIGRYLFPTDNTQSQLVQMGKLKTDMVSVIQQVQSNLNKTCVSVMNNVDEFLAFAKQGNFSANAPQLPDQANYLYYAFNTYIISQAMNGNSIYGVLGKGTNVQALVTNGTYTQYEIDCQSYSEQNVCESWWYSGDLDSTFGLDDFSSMDRDYNDVLNGLLANYTTGELLFEGAYACNANGNYGKPINITVNAGGINTACISQLRIVSWDMSCTDPSDHTRNECEFNEQGVNRQNAFWASCGSHSYFSVMDQPVYCVPRTYLGPLLTRKDYQIKR